jgi:hypothetical protein
MRSRFFTTICFGTAYWLASTAPLWAQSNITFPSPGYQADDQLTSLYPNAFDVLGNSAAVYANGQLDLYNTTTWQLVSDLGDANYGTADNPAFNSFVKFDPSGQSIWVGYGVSGNADDEIYQVTNLNSTTPAWNHVATFASNFDLAFSGGVPYVSGPGPSSVGAPLGSVPNAIWRLDTSGNNNSTEVAAVGGLAAGIVSDSSGNLYYATDFGSNDELLEFTAAQLAQQASNGRILQLSDATVLSDLPGGAYDVAVDGAGHVLFTTNNSDGSSTLGMWDGTAGDADNYTVIGSGAADHWYSIVRATGDVTTPTGAIYLSDFYNPGLAVINHLIPGDANSDGQVDINDLTIVLANFGQTGCTWSQGCMDGDPAGTVDINDLTIVLSDYGTTGSAVGVTAVPEPASAILLAAAVAILAVYRRVADTGRRS